MFAYFRMGNGLWPRMKESAPLPANYSFGHAYTSRDGIHWNTPVRTGDCGDNTSMFYNPFRRMWVYSIRTTDSQHGRTRSYRECPNFLSGAPWQSGDVKPWLACDGQDLPPSSSCSSTRRHMSLSLGRRKYAPAASAPPLMHGSTSPSKNVFPPLSGGRKSQQPPWSFHRRPVSRRNTAVSAAESAGSMPVARNICIVKRVVSHAGAPSRRQDPSARCGRKIDAPIPS
jgi:hypothetical protein